MQSGYLIIRSQDRNLSLSPSPANVFINSNISYFSNSNIASLEGESFEAFYDIPNINERNNFLLLDDGATSYPVSVPEGYYNYTELAAALQTALNLLGLGAFTVDWNVSNKNNFTMVSPVAVSVVNYPSQLRDLGDVMGFIKNEVGTTFKGFSPDITYTRNIYVTSNALHNRKRIDDQASNPTIDNVIMVVPIHWNDYYNADELSPRHVYHEPNIPKRVNFDNTTTISNIDIRLLDDQGEVLYIPQQGRNAVRWRLTISISRNS